MAKRQRRLSNLKHSAPLQRPTDNGPRDALEFMNVPLNETCPAVWAINEYDQPTGRHVDVHVGIEFGIVLKGKSRRLYPDHSFIAQEGQIWFSGIWEPHGMQILQSGTRHLVLGLLPEFLGIPDSYARCDWLQLFRLPPRHRPQARSAVQRREALAFADRIIAIMRSTDPHRLARLRIAVQELLLYFMAAPQTATASETAHAMSPGRDHLLPALRLIDQYPDRKITLAIAADAAGISRSQFAEKFRLQTGITFARYLVRRRIGGAMGDLRATDQKLQTVAARWGFADASHLVRLFQNHVGLTPDAYRRENRARVTGAVHTEVERMPKPRIFS